MICVITMFESLNSTWKIDEFPYWGFINGTGKSGGIVGNVINEDGDISGTTAFITNERIPYVDYLALTVATRANFVFRAPPLTYVSNIYLLPFQANVWSGSFILVILSIVIILITYKLVQNKVAKQELDKANFTDVILIGVGAITQLGYSKEPRINSGRIAVVFIFIVSSCNLFLEILKLLLVFLIACNGILVYIVYCKYCGFAAINRKKYSHY